MSRREGKENKFDWNTLDQYDNTELIGICLTQRQVMICKAALIPAYWSTRWMGFPGGQANSDYLDAMISMIDSQLDGNDCEICNMEFRDNPDDLCEVQYSTDGGVTWTTMFRKDVCIPSQPITAIDITNIYNDIDKIVTNNTTWDNDIVNVAPQWEYVDQWSDRALCWAIHFFVDMVCDVAIAQIKKGNQDIRDQHSWLDDLESALSVGVVATIALLGTNPVTLPAAAITAVTWATVTIVDSIWDSMFNKDWDDYEDEDARQVIKCAMYQSMEGGTPQWTDWTTSMDYHSTYGGAEASIARTVYEWTKDIDVFIQYMMLVEDINSISDTLSECPCPDRWEHFWDFKNVGMTDWVITGEYGEYIEGLGVRTTLREIATWYSNIIMGLRLGVEIGMSVPRCDGWQFHMDCVRGAWDVDNTSMVMLQPPNPQHDANSGFIWTGNPGWRHNFPVGEVDSIELGYIRSCYTQSLAGYGSIVVTGMTLYGEGVDPFSGRETG